MMLSAVTLELTPAFGVTLGGRLAFLLLILFNFGVAFWMFRVGQGGERALAATAGQDTRGDATPGGPRLHAQIGNSIAGRLLLLPTSSANAIQGPPLPERALNRIDTIFFSHVPVCRPVRPLTPETLLDLL